jgi:hypothetical protein
MAPRYDNTKAMNMVKTHSEKTLRGKALFKKFYERTEEFSRLTKDIDECISRTASDAVQRYYIDRDLKQLFDRIDYVKEEVRDHLETMRMTIKYPKMASEWIQRAISGINKTVDTRFEKVNNIKGMNLNTRLFVLGQKVYGYFTPDDEELVIDKDLRAKLSKTQHIQDVNQIMKTTNKLNDSNLYTPLVTSSKLVDLSKKVYDNTINDIVIPVVLGKRDDYDIKSRPTESQIESLIELTGITKEKAEKLSTYEEVNESCFFKKTNRSIGKAKISCVFEPEQDGILQYRPYLVIARLQDNAKAIVKKFHESKKQFKISASAQITYIRAKFGEGDGVGVEKRLAW